MLTSFFKNNYLLSILSIIIGVFYALSGLGKLFNVSNFVNTLETYGLGNFSYIAPFICIGEIVLGLLFLFLIRIKKIAFFSAIILFVFTIAFTYAHFFEGVNNCGCFGEISFLKSSYIISLIRNTIFILLSIIVYIYTDKASKNIPKWKLIIILFLVITSSIASGFTLNEPLLTEEYPFLNRPIYKTPLSNYISTSKDSTYLIFVFSYSCPHCWNATENIKSYNRNKIIDRTIGLAVENNKKEYFYNKNLKPNFKITSINIDSFKRLVKSVPTAFFVKNDTIKVVMQGEIMSPFTFKETYLNF